MSAAALTAPSARARGDLNKTLPPWRLRDGFRPAWRTEIATTDQDTFPARNPQPGSASGLRAYPPHQRWVPDVTAYKKKQTRVCRNILTSDEVGMRENVTAPRATLRGCN